MRCPDAITELTCPGVLLHITYIIRVRNSEGPGQDRPSSRPAQTMVLQKTIRDSNVHHEAFTATMLHIYMN